MTEENKSKMLNNIILENREKLSVTGVKDVDSFDDRTIIAYTDYGELTIGGEKLHIEKLSIEVGELSVVGKVSSLSYLDQAPKSSGLFGKLFR